MQEGGDRATCLERGTCFASMSASLPDGGSNQLTNYANFRIFSETLLAGILDPEFEEGIQTFRVKTAPASGVLRSGPKPYYTAINWMS